MGPLDKQNLLKSQTSKKVKAANVPMKNISQKTMMVVIPDYKLLEKSPSVRFASGFRCGK
ncbi:hypothetical protein P5673_000350 [Acropora cervicornis]|uniref:Uncharacterized protein n=1 Tax=Acropora cervicornis TaxID=6130 RepID=A0AAD9R6X2_ACRCE|nr:hypothetical protein P5673_000350 [Acropora cervicornis]